MSPVDRLLLRAILSPDHRAESGNVVLLVERDLSYVVLQRLPSGVAAGFHGLSLIGARDVLEHVLRLDIQPGDLVLDVPTEVLNVA